MKIYTRTGDSGSTGLIGGSRIPKNSLRMDAIGDVDELNAAIGLARVGCPDRIAGSLERIQNQLFDLGAELASPVEGRLSHRAIHSREVEALESSIDDLTKDLPPLRAFILPGGSESAGRLHLARCICRRAERSILELHDSVPQRREVLAFINRLSDWLFTAARTANVVLGVKDVEWCSIGD